MKFATDTLLFLDLSFFVGQNVSLSSFLKAYNKDGQQKMYFPYEYVVSFSKIYEKSLPLHLAFYSKLRKSNISEAEYAECVKIFEDKQCQTLRDYLKVYNLCHVNPLVSACLKFAKIF